MTVFHHAAYQDHEQVLFCSDPSVGLRAIIAIHSTALGPAAGGCRMHPYANEDDALADVLRLSQGMSYKNAVAGLPLGGGKCVIIADPTTPHKADLLRAFSAHVQALHGRYWTAIDVGVGPEDADVLAEGCDYVFARASAYEPGFNPSFFTSRGGFVGLRAVAEFLWGSDDLRGRRFAIQGLGQTGGDLARQLFEAGAELVVSDVCEERVRDAVSRYRATPLDPEAIHAAAVDVFVPCALGGVISDETLLEIQARAVCGLANNQLVEPRHGAELARRGIAYVPDYVVNAGGMMGASTAILNDLTREQALVRIDGLFDTILSILEEAKASGRPSSDVADARAEQRIARGRAT